MDVNSIAFLLMAFFLYWLSEGLGLLFSKACVELENKFFWHRILKKLDKEMNKNA